MGTPRTWKKALIKVVLGMTFLMLFVPQLSYKFYLCANNPSWTFKAQSSRHLSHEQQAYRTIVLEHCRPLSIDKRYSPKHHLDASMPVEIRSIQDLDRDRIQQTHRTITLAHPDELTRLLRGPPAPSFS